MQRLFSCPRVNPGKRGVSLEFKFWSRIMQYYQMQDVTSADNYGIYLPAFFINFSLNSF